MSHIHWGTRQNKLEMPNDEEKVNTREIHKKFAFVVNQQSEI
jgi:hypothetical protein